jgi:hypothetical protein
VVLLQRTSAAGNKSMLLDKGGPPSQLGGRFYALLVQLSLPKSSSAPVGRQILIRNERSAAHHIRKPPWGDELRIPSTLGALVSVFLAYALHFHSVGIERVACAVTSSQLRLLLGWVFRNLTGER